MRSCRIPFAVAALAFACPSQQWQQLAASHHPPPDAVLGLADDTGRGRLVCFATRVTSTASTWEWDGGRWLCRLTSVVPPVYAGVAGRVVATTYDPVQRQVVMVERSGGTWLFDGDNWQELTTARVPIWNEPTLWFDPIRSTAFAIDYSTVYELEGGAWVPRVNVSFGGIYTGAYDALRGEAILVGGIAVGGNLETWSWNGTTLSPRAPVSPVSFRNDFLMAFDVQVGRVLLLGGWIGLQRTTEVFSWNGSNWIAEPALPRPITSNGRSAVTQSGSGPALLTPLAAPPSVHAPDLLRRDAVGGWSTASVPSSAAVAVAFHANNGSTIAVEGSRTLSFDGFVWTDTGVPFPSASGAIAMAYHAGTARTIAVDDAAGVWSWDGSVWSAVTATPRPPARSSTSMAYDPGRNRVMLFGGQAGGQSLADTWEWDGSSWTSWPLSGPLSSPKLGYDPVGQRMVLQMSAFPFFLYAWTGSLWQQIGVGPLAAVSQLEPRLGQSPTELFMVCRAVPGPNLTYRLVGNIWHSLPSRLPLGDPEGALFYHPGRGAMILHDGRTRRDAILTLTPPTATRFGAGCGSGSSAPRLVAASLAQLGSTVRMDVLDGGASQVAFLLGDLASTNVPIGGGCVQLLPNPLVLGVAPTTAAGFCSFAWNILPNLALRGVQVHEQALLTATNGPLGGFAALTDGQSLRVGD